jgi:amino acid adenylation domain-containing protein/thioester reductase-like protein
MTGTSGSQEKRALLKRLLRERALKSKEAPLSFGQERLWFLDRLTPGSSAYCETVSARFVADVSPPILTAALNEVVRRHEILRTTFAELDYKPVQRVAPRLRLNAPIVDLTGLSEVDRERELESAMAAQSQRPFDLERGPLLRLTLIRMRERDYFGVITFHHIVGDAWSVGVFLRELLVAYLVQSGGSPPLPELAMQYSDFARWQRKHLEDERILAQLADLKKRLAGLPVVEMQLDRPRPAVQSLRGATHAFEISGPLRASLEALGREEGATLFMTTLMGFQMLLSCYTGGEDIVVGTPVAGRNRAELEGLIGFFVNIVLVRVSLRGDPTVRGLLARVRQACLEAYKDQDVPFEKLVEELRPERSLSQKPLAQVVFAHHKDLMEAPDVPGFRLEPVHLDTRTSKFDLSLYSWQGKRDQEQSAAIEYSTDLFEASTIAVMARHYLALLQSIAANPDQRVSEISFLPEEERSEVLQAGNGDRVADLTGCLDLLQGAFERWADRTPDSVAAVFEGEHLSYGELNRYANRLSHRLRSLGVGPDTRVGLHVERSLDLLVGVLGILKSGGAYVPLDPSYPEDRLRFLLEDSRAKVVVIQAGAGARLSAPGVKSVPLDERGAWASGSERDRNPAPVGTPESLAYVIYTSGSTGRPKGVAVTHANAVRLFQAASEHFDFGPDDSWSLFHSYSFDFSVWELGGALLHGGRLWVVPAWITRSPDVFYERISSERLTVLNQTPSAFSRLANIEEDRGVSSLLALRLVIFGGEALEPATIVPWLHQHGEEHPRLVNMYGITETTVHVTYRPLSMKELSAAGKSFIGRPLSDLRIYVLDRHSRPAPVGVPGEIYVGGAGLARAYLDRPALTAERFTPDPFGSVAGARLYRTGDRARWIAGGDLQYLGRVDHQVKIRGFRIELGEIESVLNEHPAVRQAVVRAESEPSGNARLIAYLVAGEKNGVPTDAELRRHLGSRLPEYMLPSGFERLTAMPLTPEGKVDRRALPPPRSGRLAGSQFVAPRTPVEEELARIWSEVLDVHPIGVDDNFFELGGHSFMAAQIVSRIRESFGVKLPLLQIFEGPTIRELVEALSGGSIARNPGAGLDLRGEARLDLDITPAGRSSGSAAPRKALLTGGTGFLGAFLLHELLARTRAEVHCLVRAVTVEEGRKRIQEALASIGLEEDGGSPRIIPVPGDLSRPYLGLSPQRFDELASEIDVIYHNGAVVSALYPYWVHKPANVLGTREVLRLSSRGRVKPVHYVSTTGVFPWTNDASPRTVPEELELHGAPLPTDGYSQSKWVAERMVSEAGARGVPICVYRPGRISGHSLTGVSNPNDLFATVLKISIESGELPQLDSSLATDLVPVDYVSQALVHLSMREDSIGRVFHLVNPNPIAWQDFIDLMGELGYPLRQVPYSSWVANWNRELEKTGNHPLAGLDLASVIRPDGSWLRLPVFDSRNTIDRLAGTGIVCPAIDASLLATYFSRWVKLGYLRPPAEARSRGRR